ncbi:diguanylate cyclase domain-containing protein [Caballeronia calidae]|uniref:diguanylate cyclase domain-containing protein n=1 Tax=Caballeronia calidae TaxID=1777139 RepID=UPI0009ED1336|nr:diguanylate cyclase [Caballeronia calidae]
MRSSECSNSRTSPRWFLSLLLIDIDHFKHVNDTYGNSTGDDVLVDFATRAAAVLPHGAQLARWGGECLSGGLQPHGA